MMLRGACWWLHVTVLMRGYYSCRLNKKNHGVQTQASATQRRYRTLAVVKQEAITRVEKPLEDSVFVWPHLLVREFFAAAMLDGHDNIAFDCRSMRPCATRPIRMSTPNPAKAPWYFLGLQEVLHYFSPTTAGVLVPGFTLLGYGAALCGSQSQPRLCRSQGGDCDLHHVPVFWACDHAGGKLFPRPRLGVALALAAHVTLTCNAVSSKRI